MGESGWSALEVIIVLILVIALLGRIFGTGIGNNSRTNTATKPKEEKVTPTRTCGKLLVKTPVSLQNISITSSGVPVEATIDPCSSFGGFDGDGSYLIAIVDSAATPLADPVEVQLQSNGSVYGFNQFMQFVTVPKKGTGYIIITQTSSKATGQSTSGARVPVRFVN